MTDPRALIRRTIRNGDLRRVFLAALAFTSAEFGTWVAVLLYAYETIGPLSVAFVAIAQLIPASLLAPAAASLGDRHPRHRVLTGGYLVQAGAMTVTGALMFGGAPVPVVLAAAIVAASSVVVSRPTQSALLPSLSRTPDELTCANGAAGIVEGAGVLLGPLAAAAILAVSTPGAVFLVAGVALLGAAALTVGLRPAIVGEVLVADPPVDALPGGVIEGLRVVASDADARLVIALMSMRMLMIGAADVFFVLLALDRLGTEESGAGILSSALGAGAIVGGAATFLIVGRPRLAIIAAIGAVAWGVGFGLVGVTGSPWLAPLLVAFGSAGLAVVDVASRTILQRSIRDEVLARAFGLQEGLAMGGLAAGSLLVPILVEPLGLVAATVACAAILPVTVVLAWPRLSALDRRTVLPAREIALLQATTLFQPLPAPQLEAVARRAAWLTVPSGTVIIREGDPGDRYYVLAGGSVRVDQGGTHLRDLARPGDGFGEIALLRAIPRTASVTATSDTAMLTLDRGPFLAALTGNRDIEGEP